MDPNTLNLIVYLEQLAGLVVKGIIDVKGVISGSSTKTADELLADADATYQQIIQKANTPAAPVPPPAA